MKTKTQFMNRILSLVLSIMMVVSMLPMNIMTASAAETTESAIDLSTLTGTYVISDSGEYIFTGSGSYGIKVESGNPTIVLNNASITVGKGSSAIDVASGSNATIFVMGDNTVDTDSEWGRAGGIFVAEGGTVNITSNSNANILRAHGSHASAIGGKYDYDNNESYNAGNINISNVTVYAYTNNFYASAIGAAGEGTCGTINITNAVVYAYGAGDKWSSAPGIGSAWGLVGWPETIPVVIISGSEIHTFRYNPYSDYIGYLGDESGDTYATGSINCGDGGSVTNSTIYCYTGLDATTTDKTVKYGALGGLLKEDGTCEGEHSGGTATCKEQAICGNCGASYGERGNHSTAAEGDRAATCKELAYCSVCQREYGDLAPENHDFGSGNTCICGAEIAFTGIVVDDENSDEYRYDETSKTYTIIIPADEVGGTGYLSYDIIGTNLTLIEDTNTLLKVQHENEDGLTSAPDDLLVDVLQDNGYFGWSVLGYGDGEWEKLLYSNDGGMTWTTYTFEVKQAYSITVNASQNGTVTANEYAIEGDNIALNVSPAEGYMLDTLSVTDASGNSVDVENNAFTMPASAVTVTATFAVCDHKDSRHETATDNGDGTHDATCSVCGKMVDNEAHIGGKATCTDKAVCDLCGASYGELAAHTPDTNGKCTVENCGYQYAAKIGDTFYETIHAALRAAEENTGCTLILLDNITLTSSSNNASYVNKGTFTLDLNGKTLSSNKRTLEVMNSADLTIRDSIGGGKIVSTGGSAVYLSGDKLTIESGAFEGSLYGVFVSGNYSTVTAIIKGGTFSGSQAMITGFGSNCVIDLTAIDPSGLTLKNNGSGTFAPKLPEGYGMVGSDGKLLESLSAEQSATVHKHEYKYTDLGDGNHQQACSCGLTTGEPAAHSTTAEDDKAATCVAPAYCSVCDSEYGDVDKTNHDETVTYENGFCPNCDAYEPAELVDGVYEISNAGQLYWFAQQVNGGNTAIDGKLTTNIVDNTGDVAGCNGTKAEGWRDWTPIGTSNDRYTGTFDGGSFTVSGLYFNNSGTSNVGLFGYIGGDGAVHDLGVVNSYISGGSDVGGVVGYALATVSVTNCYNSATVIGVNYVGGVVGYSAGPIANCHNSGTVCGTGGIGAAGGVVGRCYRTVTNCHNTGSVTGTGSLGGVVGANSGTVTNCYNTGNVSGSGNGVGGVAGTNTGTVTNCYNTGNVTGSKYTVGGMVGANSGGTVTNCYNTGSVTGSKYYVGGVVGQNGNAGTVTNCYYLTGCAKDGNDAVQFGIGSGTQGNTTADAEGGTTGKSDFSTGEVCYLLNGDQTSVVFKQTCGTGIPVFTGETVYYGYRSCGDTAAKYTNDETISAEKPAHAVAATYTLTEDGKKHIASYSCCGTTVTEDHTLTYTAKDNIITAICSANCGYSATATLTATDATYTGSAITTGASVTYSDGWAGSQEHGEITYSNNLNAGTATAKVMVEGKELTTTFEINEADISGAAVTLNPTSGTYTGTAYNPSVSVTLDDFGTLVEGTDYTLSWNKTGFTNADTYTVTVTGKGNFEGMTERTFTINAANLADVKVEQVGTLTYIGEALTPAVSANAVAVNNQPITFTYSTESEGPYGTEIPSFTNAGWAHTVYYIATADNHNTYYGSFLVEIEKATVIEPTIATKPYTGSEQTADVTDTDLYTVVKNEGGTGVKENGCYDVVLELKDSANYKWSTTDNAQVTLQFKITRAENEWTVDPSITGWTYGETANEPVGEAKFGEVSVAYSGTTNGGATYSSTTAPTEAGSYTATFIVQETEDYKGLETSVDFTIAKKAVTVTANDAGKTYGDSDPALTYNHTELVGSDALVITVARASGENANTYTITASQAEGANPNYEITFKTGTFTIHKAALTVTVEDKTTTYGDTVPNYTVKYEGFKNGDDRDDLGGALAFYQTYNQFDDVGEYEIMPYGLTSDNYVIAYNFGKLTVNAKPITVTIQNATSVYGDTLAELKATDNGIVNGDTNVYSLATTATGTSNVGKYAITGTALDSNYDVTFVNGEYEITKREITITVDAKNTVVNTSVPTYTYKVEGLVGVDTLVTEPTLTCNANIAVIGEYDITAIGADAGGNYSIKYVPAKLTVLTDNAVDAAAGYTEELKDYDPATVTSEDKAELEEMLSEINTILADETTTDNGKKALEEVKEQVEKLIKEINDAAEATDTENTEKVENVTPENVTPENKTDLENAKADLEKALEDNGGNYTEDEKKAIEDEIKRIDEALEVIGNVEEVEETISKLPAVDTVKPDDEEAIKAITDAQTAYNALSDYEKSLVDEAAKANLDKLAAALVAYDIVEGDGSSWTKDSDHNITFVVNGLFSKFVGIKVDGKDVDKANYEVKAGSTIITLKASYLDTLAVGEHTITVVYTDGSTDGTFNVHAKANSPTTGDNSNMFLWIALLFISGGAVITLTVVDRKKRMASNR